jgi:hypothetical protein
MTTQRLTFPAVSGEIKICCHPSLTYSLDLQTCDFFLFPETEIESENTPF